MDLSDKIQRSKSNEKIDFAWISCQELAEPLIKISSSMKLRVEPIWTLKNDFEGGMYADYIKDHPEYDGVYVRKSLLDKLKIAAKSLPNDLELVVRAGHRPTEVQKRLLRECAQDYKDEHEGTTEEEALAHARIFVSDPEIKLPPHCCGAAVDVDVFNTKTNRFVDFGSPVNLDDEVSYLHSKLVGTDQRANRMLLLKTMLGAGFASYYGEWWHYSYGDEIWAWYYQKKSSLYDLIDF